MNLKQLLAIPLLGFSLSNVTYAGLTPLLSSINSDNNAASANFPKPIDIDYSFNNRGLDVSVAPKIGGGGYTLTATNAGNINFYQNKAGVSSSGTGTYTLKANFDTTGTFNKNGSSLTITGSLNDTLGGTGSTSSPTTKLYSAQLTDFGTDASTAEIAFKTSFNASWSNQKKFTGGSTGESVYLFDQVGLNNGGHGRLSSLINALNTKNLASVSNQHFVGIESIASVPLPLPIVLFGTGLTALIGLGRKRLNATKAI